MPLSSYALHRLGWKAFQQLCVAIVEERLNRPVQTFLPTNDAGRDGAFIGRWDDASTGESTIQCKFTSKQDHNLSLSMLNDELPKAKALAKKGLANDYIILTNHPITGNSEIAIREAFQAAGVGRCRVFHRDWVLERINTSPSLRLMVPRLYGLVDLSMTLDDRAYKQAQLILSELGDSLEKLVVTDAHRASVKAITDHRFVLLLGSPATGKSTIGASLALGAADIWKCSTIKSTSPDHLQQHLDPNGGQFFWIDDAWGSTQYQKDRTEAWNQAFPLIQGAMKRGSRFLITSRDYIWRSARKDLKISALPILGASQVVINVEELTLEEKSQILYNHVKLGDQTPKFRSAIKSHLPPAARRVDFLPESARRLGNQLFTRTLQLNDSGLADFFGKPAQFLGEIIETLSPECQAALAMIFLNGGIARSPVSSDALKQPAESFGVSEAIVRNQLEMLNGSLLILSEDQDGPYWSYRHPTIGDAFANFVAKSPERVDIYLRGAKPETIVQEVVCAGISLDGAPLTVPSSQFGLLRERIGSLPSHTLTSFISQRSNKEFSRELIEIRPDLLKRLSGFVSPIKDDLDIDFLFALDDQGLLNEEHRLAFVEELKASVTAAADSSFLETESIGKLLKPDERNALLDLVETEVLDNIEHHVSELKAEWDSDYDPDFHFEALQSSFDLFVEALSGRIDEKAIRDRVASRINEAIWDLEDDYEESKKSAAVQQQSPAKSDSLDELFRDVDE